MAVTGIYTTITDTALGSPVISDSIAMLICPATAESGTGGLQFELDTPYLLYNVKDATDLGITDAVNGKLLFNVREFYEQAGVGARLWLVGYQNTQAGAEAFIDNTLPTVVQGTAIANFDNRPRYIGFVGDKSFVSTATGQPVLPTETQTLVGKLQTQLANMFNDSYRMCAVMDAMTLNCANATGMLTEQIATTLIDCATLNAPRVGLQITTSTPGQSASVGQTIGRMSAITIETSIGAMTLPSINQLGYFIDSYQGTDVNTNVSYMTRGKYDDMGQKQYIFTRTRPQRSGVYYNDGATCNDPIMALSSLEFLRVGNAVCDSVENFFVDYLNTNVPLEGTDIASGYKQNALADLRSRYLLPRINRQEAQDIQVDFRAVDGNFPATRAIEVTVSIYPMSSIREIYIETLFVSYTN